MRSMSVSLRVPRTSPAMPRAGGPVSTRLDNEALRPMTESPPHNLDAAFLVPAASSVL